MNRQEFLLKNRAYNPTKFLIGGNIQTIYPKLLKLPPIEYRRELHLDSKASTLIAYDFVDGNKDNETLYVIFPGLEGTSYSHYAVIMMNHLKKLGLNGVVVHYKGCGGIENSSDKIYHAGQSDEVEFVLAQFKKKYKKIYALGYSFGGNLLAKYLGEYSDQDYVEAATIVSSPFDLVSSSNLFLKFTNQIYNKYFLKSIIPKIENMYQDQELIDKLKRCKTLVDFDNVYTSKIFGYENAIEFYKDSSSMPVLNKISRPTLILYAKNDPMLDMKTMPNEDTISDYVTLLVTEHGGHCGYAEGRWGQNLTWLPNTVMNFLESKPFK